MTQAESRSWLIRRCGEPYYRLGGEHHAAIALPNDDRFSLQPRLSHWRSLQLCASPFLLLHGKDGLDCGSWAYVEMHVNSKPEPTGNSQECGLLFSVLSNDGKNIASRNSRDACRPT